MGSFISAVLGVLLIAITPFGFPVLFGRGFMPAIPAAIILVVAASISGVNVILEEVFRGLGKPAPILWAEGVGLAVTAAVLGFLLGPLGIMGAALASLLGYAATMISLLIQLSRISSISIAMIIWPTGEDVKIYMERIAFLVKATRSF
jgi:O-antigen/teichoic acid export membrane protein